VVATALSLVKNCPACRLSISMINHITNDSSQKSRRPRAARKIPSRPTSSVASRGVLCQLSCSSFFARAVPVSRCTAWRCRWKRMKPMASGSIFQRMMSKMVAYVIVRPILVIVDIPKGIQMAFKIPRHISQRAISRMPNDAILKGERVLSIKPIRETRRVLIITARRKKAIARSGGKASRRGFRRNDENESTPIRETL